MGSLPSAPLIWTIVAVGLINGLAAYALAHAVAPGRAPVVDAAPLAVAIVLALSALVLAIRGWRAHYRRSRMIS